MENNTNNNTNKRLIVPFVAISLVMVLLITGGLSYAYFTWWGTVGAVKATGTDTYPAKCTRSCSVTSTACDMTITYAGMGSGSYSTTTPAFTKTCSITVSVSGIAGSDSATYSVNLKAGTPSAATITGYTWSAGELVYSKNSETTNTNLFGVTTTGTAISASHTLTVAGTAGTCNTSSETTSVVLKFFNLNKNQTPLTSLNYTTCSNMNASVASCHDNKATTLLKYYFETPTFTCGIS